MECGFCRRYHCHCVCDEEQLKLARRVQALEEELDARRQLAVVTTQRDEIQALLKECWEWVLAGGRSGYNGVPSKLGFVEFERKMRDYHRKYGLPDPHACAYWLDQE